MSCSGSIRCPTRRRSRQQRDGDRRPNVIRSDFIENCSPCVLNWCPALPPPMKALKSRSVVDALIVQGADRCRPRRLGRPRGRFRCTRRFRRRDRSDIRILAPSGACCPVLNRSPMFAAGFRRLIALRKKNAENRSNSLFSYCALSVPAGSLECRMANISAMTVGNAMSNENVSEQRHETDREILWPPGWQTKGAFSAFGRAGPVARTVPVARTIARAVQGAPVAGVDLTHIIVLPTGPAVSRARPDRGCNAATH